MIVMSDIKMFWFPVSSELPMWTDVASAIGDSVAALVALGVAVYSVRIALGERHAQSKREHVVREAERRDQAERVSCWMNFDNTERPVNWIDVDNASGQPIWGVEVRHELLLPSGHYSFPVIPAGSRQRLNVNTRGDVLPAQVVEVSFTDNRGTRWRRNSSLAGFLVEEQLVGTPTAVIDDTE